MAARSACLRALASSNITAAWRTLLSLSQPAPPTMRAISCARWLSLSRVTSVRVAPFSSYLQTSYCVSAIAAICGRCVTQIT